MMYRHRIYLDADELRQLHAEVIACGHVYARVMIEVGYPNVPDSNAWPAPGRVVVQCADHGERKIDLPDWVIARIKRADYIAEHNREGAGS